MTGADGGLRALLALDWKRFRSLLHRPTAASLIGSGLPVLVIGSALVLLGRIGVPATEGSAGGMTVGMLIAGAVSFVAYGVLFSTSDGSFLRRVGIAGGDIYLERSLRLVLLAVLLGIAVALPYAIAGEGVARAWMIASAVALFTAGLSSLSYAGAARTILDVRRSSAMGAGMRQFDPELGRAAPLVYAPIFPFLLGSALGALAGSTASSPMILLSIALPATFATVALARRRFASAAPRFLPQVGEMRYVPPPEKGGEAFRVGSGISALLPRRAGAVWIRDAVVAARRFPWASRVTWPVVIASFFALARWGRDPSTQAWVLAAVGIALVVQSAAIVGLGLHERQGPRWIDRLAGLTWFDRFVGRWAWGFELSLWLLVPVALAWSWWSGEGPAWSWPLAGVLTAAVATAASLLNSERKS